jgi:outer membrane protein assembly factor BamD
MWLTAKRVMYVLLAGVFLVGATTCDAQILHKKKKVNKSTGAENNAQPDKVLYDKAMDNIKHGRQEVGRLSMQTLINTYPDSEYLAKAKLAIADSFYKEGGSANMTQAIASYKDFIVFFPFLPEATYAQMQVAMAHFRQMEKPDRDRTQARAAEDEFQTFLQKYPNDPLAPQAEQRLREVQEVLAEGDFRIGSYYYIKGDRRAAAGRLLAVTKRYPLYSRADRANWMLGDIFEKSEHKEVATMYYSQIVKDYPLSPLAAGAKDKLKAFGAPIPQPDLGALAWMKEEQNIPRKHATLLLKPMGLVKNGPGGELRAAARTGKPNLEPEADTFSATDILTGSGKSQIGGSGGGTTGIVATVVTGGAETATGGAGTDGGAQPAEGSTTNSTTTPTTPDPPKESAPPASDVPPANSSNTSANSNSSGPTSTAADSANTTTPASDSKTDANAPADQNSDATKATDGQGDSQKSNDSSNKKESSSKKKKGLRKIIPW